MGGLARSDGFVPFYFDPKGRVLIEVPVFNQDVLYYVSAATNPGSVEAPFDRGIIFSSVIHFERSGAKVIVNQINMGFRAVHGSAKTQEGVADSFPTSVLAVLPVEGEANGKVIVDATPLFMRDAGNIAADFKRAKLGDYKFDPAKQRLLSPPHEGVPGKYRDRDGLDLHLGRAGCGAQQRDAVAGRLHRCASIIPS